MFGHSNKNIKVMNYCTKDISTNYQSSWYFHPHPNSHHANSNVMLSDDFKMSNYEANNFDVYQEYTNYASEGSSTASTPEIFAYEGSFNTPVVKNHQLQYNCPLQTNETTNQHQTFLEPPNNGSGHVGTSTSINTYLDEEDDYYDDEDSQSFGPATSIEDEERRKRRRERNKLAATKCRHKKKEHVIQLNIESQKIENTNLDLKTELHHLEQERNHLLNLLDHHRQFCIKNLE